MKIVKVILGFVIIVGAIFLGWHFLGSGSNQLTEEELAVEFSLEEQRFAGFESNTMLAADEKASELLGEGGNVVRNFSALDNKKLIRLREINDKLSAISNAQEQDEEKDIGETYTTLTKKLEVLEKTDTTKFSAKDKKGFDNLVSEANMIIMNKMSITEPKVQQLKDVIEKIEKLIA